MTTKQKILTILEEKIENVVSGGDLSESLCISRTAIWKNIQSLKNDGYNIDSVSNTGYILRRNNDLFSTESVNNILKSIYKGLKYPFISVYQTIDSTSTEAKKLALNPQTPYPSVVLAASQTAGRGRLGRNFYSPNQTGIYLSILYKPETPVTEPSLITATAAVAVCKAISEVFHLEAGIKWVNDVFINGRKVCGILTEGIVDFETNSISSLVIGIGINIKPSKGGFPEDISKVAGAIMSETNTSFPRINDLPLIRAKLSAAVINNVLTLLDQKVPILDEYKRRSIVIGKKIEIIKTTGEKSPAVAMDIDNNCHLIAKKENGEIVALSSGEVSLRSAYFAETN